MFTLKNKSTEPYQYIHASMEFDAVDFSGLTTPTTRSFSTEKKTAEKFNTYLVYFFHGAEDLSCHVLKRVD